MDVFIRVAAIGIVAAVLVTLLKKNAPEISLILALAAAAIIISFFAGMYKSVKSFIDTMTEMAGLSSAVIAPLMKTLAIAIICKLASEICRDASQNALAAAVEMTGAVTALYIALPLFNTAIQMIMSLI